MKVYENLDINDLDGEIWKDILDYEGLYQISNFGRIKSFKQDKINGIVRKLNKIDKYLSIGLSNKKQKNKYIHHLMYESFIGNIPEGYVVHHIDKKPENNFLYNFKLMTKEEHSKLHNIGNKYCVGRILSEEHKNKISKSEKGKIVSKETKNKISNTRKEKFKNGELNINGENHPMFGKHLSEETKRKISESKKSENNQSCKLSNQDVYDIRKSLELKLYTPKQLSWMFDVSIATISLIKNNKSWIIK